jgi:hypothetical protein
MLTGISEGNLHAIDDNHILSVTAISSLGPHNSKVKCAESFRIGFEAGKLSAKRTFSIASIMPFVFAACLAAGDGGGAVAISEIEKREYCKSIT